MTTDIAIVLALLAGAVVLFVSERLRPDLVALLVMVSLTLTGVLSPAEALAGFSSPAVITVWAVFILSGALYRVGVANALGRRILPVAGDRPGRLTAVLMALAAALSAFMNNVAVVALMMPAVVDLLGKTRTPASKLLIPLAYASLMGGMLTLIGTPPNILIAGAVADEGLGQLGLFDFARAGLPVALVGIAFMVTIGRRLLPAGRVSGVDTDRADLARLYSGEGHRFVLALPEGSQLAGHTLAESRLGAALGLNVVAIARAGQTLLAPSPDERLAFGDRLVVEGPLDRLELLRGHRPLRLARERIDPSTLIGEGLRFLEATVAAGSALAGRAIHETGLRDRHGAVVIALRRPDSVRHSELAETVLTTGDVLLLAVPADGASAVTADPSFASVMEVTPERAADAYGLRERLLALRVPQGSALAGTSLGQNRVGDAMGLAVLAIERGDETILLPGAHATLEPGDELLVSARLATLRTLRGLRGLSVERELDSDLASLESPTVGFASVVLSPYSRLAGSTLRAIHFREKYGLNVVAIWRGGDVYSEGLRDMPLRFGDALLLHGPRAKLSVLGSEPDFLVLTEAAREPPRVEKAPITVALLLLVFVVPLVAGWLEPAVAAVLAAALVVLAGALTMDEAYRFIEWRAVFLIACMLPLGTAMEKTGAAQLIADSVVGLVGGFGALAVIAAVFVLTSAASQVMPSAASALLLAPIAIHAAEDQGVSALTLAMTVAVAASASFLSPVGHPANVLVMGPGGYRFADYLRVGLPLTLVVLVVALIVLPIAWPLYPAGP